MLRRYFIAGLLVWVPLLVTLFVIRIMVQVIDQSLTLLPTAYQPQNWFGFDIPGLGLLFTATVVFVTGIAVTNFLGNKIVHWGEKIVERIPLVRSIYSAVKQILHTVFNHSEVAFRKVLLVQYPREGSWSIAFQTNSGFKEGEEKLSTELVTVFIPTTPNPTSGFLLMVPKAEVIELKMAVDDALKMVISLGVVLPQQGINKETIKVNSSK